MEISTMCVIGGAAVGIAIISTAILYAKRNKSNTVGLSEVLLETADEQLVVEDLQPHDLTEWFKKRNANGIYTNIAVMPNERNIEKFHLPKGVSFDDDKVIFQTIYDEKNDKMLFCRTIVYEKINSNLKKMFEENDGSIIVE